MIHGMVGQETTMGTRRRWAVVGAALGAILLALGCGAGGIDEVKNGPVTIRDTTTPTPDPHSQPPQPPASPLF